MASSIFSEKAKVNAKRFIKTLLPCSLIKNARLSENAVRYKPDLKYACAMAAYTTGRSIPGSPRVRVRVRAGRVYSDR